MSVLKETGLCRRMRLGDGRTRPIGGDDGEFESKNSKKIKRIDFRLFVWSDETKVKITDRLTRHDTLIQRSTEGQRADRLIVITFEKHVYKRMPIWFITVLKEKKLENFKYS